MTDEKKNAGQNPGQRDPSKPQKPGGMGEKPVSNPGNVGAGMDPNKNVKTPGQGPKPGGVADRQPSSNPVKHDEDVDLEGSRGAKPRP
jgi:hypothetical protein